MRPSVAAPEIALALVKLAASISLGSNASRHSSEFAANASMATPVSNAVRDVRWLKGFGEVGATLHLTRPIGAGTKTIFKVCRQPIVRLLAHGPPRS